MLRLTDTELDIVMRAAHPLDVSRRDEFLQAVAERLATIPERGDGIVFQVCREIQRDFWEPPVFGPTAVAGISARRFKLRKATGAGDATHR
jgi:hypothetical protein